MAKIETEILNALINKYERSVFFKQGSMPTKKIKLNLYGNGKSEFPQYDIENSEKRLLVNNAVESLKEKDIVLFKWERGETNHIISEVWLVFERLDCAYKLAGRIPKKNTVDEICIEIEQLQSCASLSWAVQFLQDTLDFIRKNKKIPALLPDNKFERNNLYKTIKYINSMGEIEMPIRIFSMGCFSDSKMFERSVKSKLLSILRKYNDLGEDATEEDVLSLVGIVKYPEQFDFCGNIQICINNKTIDYYPLNYGGSISIYDIRRGIDIDISNISRIITIENRANYFAYIKTEKRDDELVVYHGGQYSPARKTFFLALKKAIHDNCAWLHWGDIDYGGFSMLLRLRREISEMINPFRMSVSELQKYSEYTATISKSYREKLSTLLDVPLLSDSVPCIRYMIDNNLRLEQEAMLME